VLLMLLLVVVVVVLLLLLPIADADKSTQREQPGANCNI